jgi:hypothetical protein
MDLGLAGDQLGQDPPEPERLLHELGPDQVLAGRGGIALVEDQVDHLEHRGEALAELAALRHLERHPRGRQRALGPDDALRHGRLRRQVRPRDLPGRQPAQEPQGERHPRVGGEHRVAGREDEPQEVVVERIGGSGRDVDGLPCPELGVATQLLGLALRDLRTAQPVDAAVLGRGHEPGARVVRDARLGPLLEGGDERLLSQVLGHSDVAHQAGDARDQPRRLDSPDGLDGACDVAARHGRGYAKSSASNTGRISTSPFSLSGFGIRFTHSIASSIDFTCHSQ